MPALTVKVFYGYLAGVWQYTLINKNPVREFILACFNNLLNKEVFDMQLIEWEVGEDGYEEQVNIPKEQRDVATSIGISTEEKQKVVVRILNLKTGESYTGRLAITGTHQIYLPTEIQKMLKGSGRIRIQIL